MKYFKYCLILKQIENNKAADLQNLYSFVYRIILSDSIYSMIKKNGVSV